MVQYFNIFFIVAILFCVFILSVSYFLIYKKIKINLQHVISFGAGFLTIFIVFDFIPHALHVGDNIFHSIIFMLCGFAVNTVLEMVLLPRLKFLNKFLPREQHDCQKHDAQHTHYHLVPSNVGCSVLGCFILCAFFDGFRLVTAVLIDVKTAIIMSIGLFCHLLPEVISIIGIGLSSRFSQRALLGIIIIFCLSFLGGYQLSFLLSHIKFLQNFLFSFTAGLLIYVNFVHFIPMVIKCRTKKWFFISASLCFILVQISDFITPH